MRTVRELSHPRSFFVRALLGVALAVGVIAGLLAMHTLSGGDLSHGHSTASLAAVASMDASMPSHAEGSAPAPHERGHGTPTEEHSMLAMACVLGFLITLLVLSIPLTVGRLKARELLPWHGIERAARTLARARPPSLLVLSISRT
ncbi:DUF6153 family protein [Microbacterium pumilum]|uniref:Uncharacterized protein n=1 Tax=Microbacterium pumilum TaxID=344165 RepID=A0ABP5E4A2_9MICO